MKTLTFFLFLAAGPILSADVITSVVCNPVGLANYPGAPGVTDPHHCSVTSVTDSAAIASATVNANLVLASSSTALSSVAVVQHADASPYADPTKVAGSFSQATIQETLFTSGAVRPGFVQITASANSNFVFRHSSAQQYLSLGNIYVDCTTVYSTSVACTFFPQGDNGPGGTSVLPSGGNYAFTLGQAFNLHYAGNASAYSSANQSGTADIGLQFQFRFFEADGVTPVAIQAAPEPGALTLLGAALGTLIVGRRKLQR